MTDYPPCPRGPFPLPKSSEGDNSLCTREQDKHHVGSLPSRVHTREDTSPFIGGLLPDMDAIHDDPYDRNTGTVVRTEAMTYNVDTCKLCGKVITTDQG